MKDEHDDGWHKLKYITFDHIYAIEYIHAMATHQGFIGLYKINSLLSKIRSTCLIEKNPTIPIEIIHIVVMIFQMCILSCINTLVQN
jgi:hypothetical protein